MFVPGRFEDSYETGTTDLCDQQYFYHDEYPVLDQYRSTHMKYLTSTDPLLTSIPIPTANFAYIQ